MSHFHCLHGAWHGAWVWLDMARDLENRGHSVSSPDLPGLGTLAIELDQNINLESHIAAALPPQPSVLIAHSYAGILARAVADRYPQLVENLLLIEALWPDSGESAIDQLTESGKVAIKKQIETAGKGWMIPPPDASQFDMNDAQLEARVNARLTPQPASTFLEPLFLKGKEPVGTYLIANDRTSQPYTATAKRLHERGWRVLECTGGHAQMLTRTNEITQLSLQLATEGTANATRT